MNSTETDDSTEAIAEQTGEMPSDGEAPSDMGEVSSDMDEAETESSERSFDNADVAENSSGDEMDVGTPDAGTTQAAGSSTNSNNYSSYTGVAFSPISSGKLVSFLIKHRPVDCSI